MKSNFDASLALVLKSEGGYVNDSRDPGGATNFGITQRVFDAYCAMHNLPISSVRTISSVEVSDIYRTQYWDAIRGDDLPIGIDYVTFDEAVNSGVSPAAKDLQTALGVSADGVIGLITVGAANKANKTALINRICDLRLNWLHRLVTWRFFGKGWSNRIAFVRANALKMAGA